MAVRAGIERAFDSVWGAAAARQVDVLRAGVGGALVRVDAESAARLRAALCLCGWRAGPFAHSLLALQTQEEHC